jgi:uncharacterized protein involved in exopolysaccharide biosynthesis
LAEPVAVLDELKSADRWLKAVSERPSTSLVEVWRAVQKSRRLFLSVIAVLVGFGLLYCFVAPREYEVSAHVALRLAPASTLALASHDVATSRAFASGPIQLETLANVLRSEQLSWGVITRLRLYESPRFARRFKQKFPGFIAANAGPDAKEYLLETFRKDLTVEGIPHTPVLAIRSRSRDGALSAAVVNGLLEEYVWLDGNERVEATRSGQCCAFWVIGSFAEVWLKRRGTAWWLTSRRAACLVRWCGFIGNC